MIDIVVQALWFMFPAYTTGPGAVFLGGGRRMDSGRLAKDGRPLLGKGKTWRGFFGGMLTGIFTGSVLAVLSRMYSLPVTDFRLGEGVLECITALLLISLGAMLGDLMGSYIKRRMGIESGGRLPFMDQLDFVFGTWLLLAAAAPSWFFSVFTAWHAIFILVFTPVAHRITNIAGYYLGKKEVPW